MVKNPQKMMMMIVFYYSNHHNDHLFFVLKKKNIHHGCFLWFVSRVFVCIYPMRNTVNKKRDREKRYCNEMKCTVDEL